MTVVSECVNYFVDFLDGCVSQRVRGIMEFAEEVVIMPNDGGPYEGLPFSRDYQPHVEVLFREIDNGPWAMILVVGPSQSGKTFCSWVIIVIWIVCELKENMVAGVPDENMINDKWSVDMQPVFESTPELKALLPSRGAGSSGGRIKQSVKLKNGRQIRFMTKGGTDQSKAGFTARKTALTEIAGFSGSQETSKEASSFQQIQARQKSASQFDEDGNIDTSRRVYAEGTVTDEEDLPWSEFENSTQSKVLYQCVHVACRQWIRCERPDLHGWQNAADELEAAANSHFVCPSCNQKFNTAQREAMIRGPKRLLHKGQEIDRAGNITGPLPRTSTLWYRYSAWDNLFLKPADFGAEEWRASKKMKGTPEHDNAERQLCQQTWAVPFEPVQVSDKKLKADVVAKRGQDSQFPPGVLPRDTSALAVGIDVGLWEIWHCGLVGRRSGSMHIPFYGRDHTKLQPADLKGKSDEERAMHSTIAVTNCLLRIFYRLDNGFGMLGSAELRQLDIAFIDASYLPAAVFNACRRYGEQTGNWEKYIPIYGRGKSSHESQKYKAPTKTGNVVRAISETGLWFEEYNRGRGMTQVILDVDTTKLTVQAGLRVPSGLPGSLSLYQGSPKDHGAIGRHLAAEIRREYLEDGEIKTEWKKKGMNHLLDSCGYGFAGLDHSDWFLPEIPHDLVTNDVAAAQPQMTMMDPKLFLPPSMLTVEPVENAFVRRLRELEEQR